MPSEVELHEFLRRAPGLRRPDLDAELSHLHQATTTRRPRESLYVLAFDHRRQLEELADEHGAPRARIADFKDLIGRAVEKVAAGTREQERLGVIVDARHGTAVLNRLTPQGFWIGRPIETPSSRPVAFDPPDNVGLHLLSWPLAHVIKCLVFFHPDDPVELRLAQERQIRVLNDAARALDRELLLEIICSGRGLPVDDTTTARALTRIYNLGVRPAWWKLETQSRAAWSRIEEVIARRDPTLQRRAAAWARRLRGGAANLIRNRGCDLDLQRLRGGAEHLQSGGARLVCGQHERQRSHRRYRREIRTIDRQLARVACGRCSSVIACIRRFGGALRMSDRIRLTTSQALVRYLAAQRTVVDGEEMPLCAGVFAIFGHGNVAGIGEALAASRAELPTYRAHNEQGMAHAAIAFAKTLRRRRFMACTTSIGPGATNMVTAAALAHVNRLPVLLLPGDVFASRRPDPVLQQVEDFGDPTVTANDCFRPVSRYWDRINRPEQLLRSLPQALSVLTDPAECGPVTLALPQDVQAEAWEYPTSFFEPRVHRLAQLGADTRQLAAAAEAIKQAKRPLIIAGGGVHYAQACEALARFCRAARYPGRGDAGGQRIVTLESSAERRIHRRDRLERGERVGPRRGRHHRHRHPAAGFHDRLGEFVSATRNVG